MAASRQYTPSSPAPQTTLPSATAGDDSVWLVVWNSHTFFPVAASRQKSLLSRSV